MNLKSTKYLSTILVGILLISCKKDDPDLTCTGGETCEATLLNEGFKSNLVGKWKFYKQRWSYETLGGGSLIIYKTPEDLGAEYEVEISADGMFKLYRNDTLIENKKLEVRYEMEYSNPMDVGLGGVVANFDCIYAIHDTMDRFSCHMLSIDTFTLSRKPIFYHDESSNERSGAGYFYRMP